MTEPEPNRRAPDSAPPGTASFARPRILDVAAAEAEGGDAGTASFQSAGLDLHASTVVAPAVDEDTDPQPPPDFPQLDGYRVLRVLGRGGTGTVLKARELALDRLVAIKLVHPAYAEDPTFRARFDREAKTLASLDHENVVPIYSVGSWQGVPYLTMKFIDGKTLYHHLRRFLGDFRGACEVMAKVARAVQYLHAQGVIHRDLKPANILMTDGGVPLVADFSLVRPIRDEAELSLTSLPLGTRPYMSPEQTRGGRDNYTPACDIWALGVILYEVLTDTRPFSHDDDDELFRQIRFDPTPPMPPVLNVPPSLEAITRKCLAKEIADRYATAGEVATDLERWLAGDDVRPLLTESPQSALAQVAPSTRGKKVRWAVAAAAMLALLGFSGVAPQQVGPNDSPPRTISERLRDGETVWLIRDKGRPVVLDMPGGRVATVAQDGEGYCAVGTADVALVELVNEPLPDAFILGGEVAVASGNTLSRFGFYAGRQSWGPRDAVSQSVLGFTVNGPLNKPWPHTLPAGRAEAEAVYLSSQAPYLHSTALTTPVEYDPIPIPQPGAHNWQQLHLRFEQAGFTFKVHDKQSLLTPKDRALARLRNIRPKLPDVPELGDPVAGGLGLFVSNGKALYRNVRLLPVPK